MLPVIITVLVILAAVAGYFVFQGKGTDAIVADDQPGVEAQINEQQDISEGNITAATAQNAPVSNGDVVALDVNAAMAERTLGNPEAPIVIREFASLTCGHCGDFHKNTFPAFKTEFIDTGKVFMIFTDFPLNGPALHASMVARCLPADRYFSFLSLLFNNQDKWAYDAQYINYLRQNAALAGLGNDAFEACIGNDELREAVLGTMRTAQTKYEINSTPSFVINEEKLNAPGHNIEVFRDAIGSKAAE